MQLEHSFTVPVGIDDAWKVLLDIERIAPCMPGAALDSVDGDNFTGTVKVKLGPIGLTYKGKAGFVEKDEAAHRAVINAQGRDARGNGTASAKVTATLTEHGAETQVDVVTDLDITGKPAQFGRGVMADVGNKLIGQFADCLAGKLSGGGAATEQPAAAPAVEPAAEAAATIEPAAAAAEPTAEPAAAAAEQPAPAPRSFARAEVEPIDLLEHAGPAVAKRLIPVAAAIVLLLIILRLRKH
ncbi:MAG TPA: SRPBCC family protein [Jatrophihabitans sp.]